MSHLKIRAESADSRRSPSHHPFGRDKVLGHVDAGEYGKAAQLCGGHHPLQKMMLAAIERANRSEKEIRRNVETCAVTGP
jgi:hypothetical protein